MEILENIQLSVAKIICGLSTGSGFWNDEVKAFITNYHVVSGERRVAVQLADGRKVAARVITVNPRVDIALVRPEQELNLPGLRISPRPLSAREPVFALGFPSVPCQRSCFSLPTTRTPRPLWPRL